MGYPKWKFKADGAKQIVMDPNEEHELGPGWTDAPNAVPEPPPVVMVAKRDDDDDTKDPKKKK